MSDCGLIRRATGVLMALALASTAACGGKTPANETAAGPASPQLIPLPASLEIQPGHFDVTANTRLVATGEAAETVARQFAGYLQQVGGPALKLSDSSSKPAITFVLDEGRTDESPEAYLLEVTPDGITVSAGSEPGLFYGAVTLWQLMTGGETVATRLPALRIDDSPRFGWRGFMLDSARHFWTVDQVKQVIDAMALHKLNTFHWHLTDDQGWRVEIKQYPKLTGIGGCRIPAGDGGIDPATGEPRPYCGHYTQEQIRDIVAYAAERHITIVPEMNVPGHATAAIAAYPELGSTDRPLVPSSEWGVFPNLVNAEESTFEFLENVIGEMIGLFPGTYFHIGGDEAVKDQWEASARVQERMREVGAKTEMEMQSHLVARLEKFLAAHGKRLVGWDEILEGPMPAEATVMSWRGIEGGLKAAREGHDVVMTPVGDLYLDYLQTESPNEPPGRPATITLQDVYAFEPVPEALEESQHHHIIGVQANLWTEHTRFFERLQHNVFPRLAALAETAWSPQSKKDFANFLERLPSQLRRYDATGLGYAKTPFEVGIAVDDDRAAGSAHITLTNPLGYPVHYTTDGSAPTAESPRYEAPFTATLPARVSAAAFFDGKPLAAASEYALDAASLLSRTDEQLSICPDSGRLLLRLEDDGPLEGERAIFNTTIFYPCWQWNNANLDGIGSVNVRAGRIPYYFQLAHDEKNRKFEPARTAHGELEIRASGCKGDVLASAPLPADTDADGFIDISAPLPESIAGQQDLCILLTGDTRPQMWVVDRVDLVPR